MVKIVMGLKGSGKTKTLVDLVKKALDEDHGNVVCIEKDKNLTYDIPYTARLIGTSEYGISTNELLRGFISGLHAGNYDITHVFIDNLGKILNDTSDESLVSFLTWLDNFSNREKVNFLVCLTADPESASEDLKKFIRPVNAM